MRFNVPAAVVVQPVGFALSIFFYAAAIGGIFFFVTWRDPWEKLGRWPWGRIGIGAGIFAALSWAYKLIAVYSGW